MTDYLNGEITILPSWARYDGNPLIKKAFVKINYTEEQIEELIKCSEDIIYFTEKYIYIVDPDEGKKIIKLRPYQKRMLQHLKDNRFSVCLAPRQIGKSTLFAIYLVWFSIFHKDKKSIVLANKEKTAKDIFGRVKLAYEKLPYWMQAGITEWNVTSLTLENGSSISCAATSGDGIRGISVTGNLILDEYAFIKKSIAEDFYTSVYPTISASKEAKIIVVSTPNGLNHFADLWKKAEKGKNSYKPCKVDWWEIPGRDTAWLEKTKGDVGESKLRQEYLAEFLGSTNTLINVKTLESLESGSAINTLEYGLRVYEAPIKDHSYVIGVDTAKGTGGDSSVAQVLDISVKPIKQVAVYACNTIGTYNFAFIVEKIGKYYNDAFLSIENNSEGSAVLTTLWNELEYENIVDYMTNKKELGIRATVKTKSQALDILKDSIESGKIIINDQETIYELSRFVDHGNGRYSAEDGEHDDYVSALYWALFITSINDYYEKEPSISMYTAEVAETEDEEPLQVFMDEDDHEYNAEDLMRDLLR